MISQMVYQVLIKTLISLTLAKHSELRHEHEDFVYSTPRLSHTGSHFLAKLGKGRHVNLRVARAWRILQFPLQTWKNFKVS